MKRFLIIVLLVALIISGCVAKPKDVKPNVVVYIEPPKPTETPVPARTIKPTVVETDYQESEPTSTPTITSKPQTVLKDLPNLIKNDINKYSQTIKQVTNSKVDQIKVYSKDGEVIEGTVYKYNNEYFVISKNRKGFIAEYNSSLKRYEAEQILQNVDGYNTQIYFEAGFSLKYTSNNIEVWKLGKRTDFVETDWAKYLKNIHEDHIGYCLNDMKFPYYIGVGDNKIHIFRFYTYGNEAKIDDLFSIKAEYYVNYKNHIFYKEGTCIYIFNGFSTTKVVENVKGISYDKKTYEPIISLQNGKTIYGDELF